MKIRIVRNGTFRGRAFEIIRKRFPAGWIIMPFPGSGCTDELIY